MNFDLSEEQELLQETVKQLLANELPATHLREIFEGDTGHDPALWKGLVEMGIAGLIVPEEYGGADLELLDLAVCAEALGWGGAPGPFFGHSVACIALELAGSEAQKKSWLPRLATGDAVGTFAFGEAGGLWNPSEWTLVGGDTLTGVKLNVPTASLADLLVVGVAGGGLVLVERSASGISVEDMQGVDRSRRIDSVTFENTPCEAMPGDLAAANRVRDAALILLAADAFAAASKLVDMCVEYAKTREQFGVTIGHFQGLKHQLANMAIDIEPSRALYWYAAHAFDHIPEESERSAALAKSHISDRAMEIGRDSVEAHGGIGFTWECDVQLWFKRAMFDRAFLGTPSLHRDRIAQMSDW
ncbi:MAG: acyl-CoA/acyl-ACP dehydrogenase [Myxococcales bacterium]|nr:acyl-CoA/acyl-ACP dehydrogenase [Myxococcales bacterium]